MIAALPVAAGAQSAIDAFHMSQNDLRGTARFMSMAGAFGALGGDITTLSQNPGGIGVYRSSDVSATLDVDMQSVSSTSPDGSLINKTDQTKVSCNAVGYVGAYRIDSDVLRTFNWGFSYNRKANHARHHSGNMPNMGYSLSNFVAGQATANGFSPDELLNDKYTNGAPWMDVLAYDGSMINPTSDGKGYQGLYGAGTGCTGGYEVLEEGGVDEFNFSLGGNIKDVLYWGMTVGVTNFNRKAYTYYGEDLTNAYINSDPTTTDADIVVGDAAYALENSFQTTGTGYNFKLGVILRPCNELRLGAAFHTPTYYNMSDVYYTSLNYDYAGNKGSVETNDGVDGETWYRMRTPWHFIGSAAVVVGTKGIISFDYERIGFNDMCLKSDTGVPFVDTNNDIKAYYKGSNVFRIGAEYRVDRNLSVRAGYSYQDSPVNEAAYNNQMDIYTVGTTPAYSFDKSTQYITCGLGYKWSNVYVDLAYVHKTRESRYFGFSTVSDSFGSHNPVNTVKDNNNRIVATLGIRF